ncbi:MAG TPA: polysaccharide biosynthesis protein [Firmicutes bacterium]|nr:polysaccharide biosynthesis protein [Bacillota bacterium]
MISFKKRGNIRKAHLGIRKLTLFVVDLLTLSLSGFAAFYLSNVFSAADFRLPDAYWELGLFVFCNLLSLALCGTYRSIWRYAEVKSFLSLIAALCFGSAASYFAAAVLGRLTSSLYMVLSFLVAAFAMMGMRLVYQYIYTAMSRHVSTELGEPTMIVGAGQAGRSILLEMQRTNRRYRPLCIVDDSREKVGRTINGVRVYGPTEKIPELCERFGIHTILFAIPSCMDTDRRRILQICSATKCKIEVLPYLDEMICEKELLNQAKNINVEDLLGRKTIQFDHREVAAFVENEVCMVTGGGGSIGSELCRQIVKYRPRQLIIVDIYENNAYEIQQELLREYGDSIALEVQIASIRDFKKMDRLFRTFRPGVVFHAAAHKHVPLMETNPEEAVKNNVIGTFNVANLADLYRVKKFVLVSTDKAVNPTNVMGATKRCCEMIMQYMAEQSTGTEYVAVRFGNVLGSNGSVIPLFRKQIEAGGPVTVTDPDIIRYFMTIPEAVSLILQAGAMAKGGEIFVLDMGEPVRILNLAENLIRQYGKEPYRDIQIEFTGLRPGEKLFEELLMSEEGLQSTMNHKIFIGNQIPVDIDDFIHKMKALKEVVDEEDVELIIRRLYDLVPTFQHEALKLDPSSAGEAADEEGPDTLTAAPTQGDGAKKAEAEQAAVIFPRREKIGC